MDTLFLNPNTWDLVLDASRNIALANAPYALAQDAASAIKTFLGEVYYDASLGLPYWDEILGHRPPLEILKADLVKAALTVPGVVAAQVFLSDVAGRQVTGQVQITDTLGVISAAGF